MIKRFAAGPSLVIPGSGGGGTAAPSPGAARRPAGGGGGSDATKDAVRTMQQLMSSLNTELQKTDNSEKAFEAVKKANNDAAPTSYPDAAAIATAARSWGNTSSGGTSGTFDGIWGPNTKKQLEAIKKFIADTKLTGVIIQEGTGTRPYREMKEEDVKKIAEDNIANLGRLFTALSLTAPNIPGANAGELSSFPLDRIDDPLTTEAATSATPWVQGQPGRVMVTVGDVRSLVRFFQFIQGLHYGNDCKALQGADRGESRGRRDERSARRDERNRGRREPDVGYADDIEMETLAEFILSHSLIRLAAGGPDTGRGGVATSTRPAENIPNNRTALDTDIKEIVDPWGRDSEGTGRTGGGQRSGGTSFHCFYTVDEIFRWFASRARMVLAQVRDFTTERRPHPFYPNRLTNAQDLAAAQAYLAAVSGLWEQWSRLKRDVLKQLQDKGPEGMDRPEVTLEMIMQGGAGDLPTPGAGRAYPGGGRGGHGGGGSSTIPGGPTVQQWVLNGPIQRQMPLGWLLREDAFGGSDFPGVKRDQLAAESTAGQLPTNLDRDEWRGGNWVNIALTSIEGDSNTEKLRKFVPWAGLVRDALYELYNGWEARYRDELSRDVIAQQSREISQWGNVITSIITRAQYGMARAIGMYGGGNGDAGEPSSRAPARR